MKKLISNIDITPRSAAFEYLTFVAATSDGGVEVNPVNYHQKKIFSDAELDEISVIRNFRITADDGNEYITAESEFKKYRIVQDRLFQSDFDRFLDLESTHKKEQNETKI